MPWYLFGIRNNYPVPAIWCIAMPALPPLARIVASVMTWPDSARTGTLTLAKRMTFVTTFL